MSDIYLASPWFNDEQAERLDYVAKTLKDAGYDVFEPKNQPAGDFSTEAGRKQVFNNNVTHIEDSKSLFAITNGKDMGTIFESGVAFHAKKPIIYFAEGLTGPFNLMLAASAVQVFTTREQLEKALTRDEDGKNLMDELINGDSANADFFKGEIE